MRIWGRGICGPDPDVWEKANLNLFLKRGPLCVCVCVLQADHMVKGVCGVPRCVGNC